MDPRRETAVPSPHGRRPGRTRPPRPNLRTKQRAEADLLPERRPQEVPEPNSVQGIRRRRNELSDQKDGAWLQDSSVCPVSRIVTRIRLVVISPRPFHLDCVFSITEY